MAEGSPTFFVFERATARVDRFVQFWAGCYEYPDCELYEPNIGALEPEKLKALFEWKIGKRFFTRHWPAIERLFIARLDEARALPPDVSAERVLELFDKGGAVYRIFWLHCLRPRRFPIYDQHVHRAMNLIEGVKHKELGTYMPKAQVALYLNRYLPFWSRHFGGRDDPRAVDQALWAFGKFMNEKRDTSFARRL